MTFPVGAVIGCFLGFAFGVGCAFAVMHSIYMGDYRAALREQHQPNQTERLRKGLARLETERAWR